LDDKDQKYLSIPKSGISAILGYFGIFWDILGFCATWASAAIKFHGNRQASYFFKPSEAGGGPIPRFHSSFSMIMVKWGT